MPGKHLFCVQRHTFRTCLLCMACSNRFQGRGCWVYHCHRSILLRTPHQHNCSHCQCNDSCISKLSCHILKTKMPLAELCFPSDPQSILYILNNITLIRTSTEFFNFTSNFAIAAGNKFFLPGQNLRS